jgi:hypothetical protein
MGEGQWQAPRPPGGKGRKAGIAIAAIVVIAALGVGGVLLKNHLGGDDGPKTEVTSYQLVLPVSTGDFHIAKPAQEVTDFDQDRLDEVGLSDPKGSSATYYAGISPEEAANLDPSQLGGIKIPVCVWADPGTVGFVTFQRQNAQGPVDLPLAVAADHTATLRTAALVTTSATTDG